MTKLRSATAALLCIVPQIAAGALFPTARLTFLAPLITSNYYRFELQGALWLSFAAGLLADLLGSTGRLGILSTTYCLATILLYPQKRHFFPESPSTVPILSMLFGLATTLLTLLLLWPPAVIHGISPSWILTDLVAMPLADGAYACIGFVLPMAALFDRRPKSAPYRMPRPE